jgi:hypothetical protein
MLFSSVATLEGVEEVTFEDAPDSSLTVHLVPGG